MTTESHFVDDQHCIHVGFTIGTMTRFDSGFTVTPVPDEDDNWTPDIDIMIGAGSERHKVRFRILPEAE